MKIIKFIPRENPFHPFIHLFFEISTRFEFSFNIYFCNSFVSCILQFILLHIIKCHKIFVLSRYPSSILSLLYYWNVTGCSVRHVVMSFLFKYLAKNLIRIFLRSLLSKLLRVVVSFNISYSLFKWVIRNRRKFYRLKFVFWSLVQKRRLIETF